LVAALLRVARFRITVALYDCRFLSQAYSTIHDRRCTAELLETSSATVADGRHRHCGAILQGTKSVTSQDNVVEVQFHSDDYDNTSQDFRHATRLLKGVWLRFTPGTFSPVAGPQERGDRHKRVRKIFLNVSEDISCDRKLSPIPFMSSAYYVE